MFKCPAIVCASSCAGFDGDSVFSHVWRGGSHWFHPRNCCHKKVLVLKIWKPAKNGEKSAQFAIYFYQIHHFWYVLGQAIKQFFMPLNLVPFTCVHDLQACLFELNKFGHFFSLDTPFFTVRPTSGSSADPLKVVSEGSMVEYLSFGS